MFLAVAMSYLATLARISSRRATLVGNNLCVSTKAPEQVIQQIIPGGTIGLRGQKVINGQPTAHYRNLSEPSWNVKSAKSIITLELLNSME
ncbi:hypothetical protein DPEC_G00151390 [Dallia pectoralis]|uniref:Uncharacterized protein n=1 Tax=Dallia pectoralis TaxID=75939 RepID=A0ACC2GJU7_DALPE|nr:hypothetical protein DPEC_G00151390 [Dallia pectoralis]